ncbi:hypothetical protein SCHPADRAFT_828441 [Schizopora paradoxa]|uniref:Uncharacterized protein n=1 Tax=Schizopora paradoxa TaxID=27342 RepID=A0A0H2S8G3_9AGAM|nr:hypothetical protein SCHPADRAFT_828441 [Schizopora paradoxa]
MSSFAVNDNIVLPLGKLPTEDVTFTPVGGQAVVLRANAATASREGLAIWRVQGKVWKVYRKAGDNGGTKKLDDLRDDYNRAQKEGLPMGTFSFEKGRVQEGTQRPTDGFVLITDDMEGKNFQKGSFKVALRDANVPKNKDDAGYKQILAGCEVAMKVGLKDCQGFLKTGITQPLRFIDVHTSYTKATGKYGYSGDADEILTLIKDWPTS